MVLSSFIVANILGFVYFTKQGTFSMAKGSPIRIINRCAQ